MREYKLPMSRLSQVVVWKTDRQTRSKLYTMALHGWSKLNTTLTRKTTVGVS